MIGLPTLFQYISCCSLSFYKKERCFDEIKFQYISCCSLSLSHVLILSLICSFQYISCCSLSADLMGSIVVADSFNTSHVVVYLEKIPDIETVDKFQYISCCSLSHIYMRFVINCFLIFHWNLNYYLNFYQPSYYFLIFQFQSSLMLELQHFYS